MTVQYLIERIHLKIDYLKYVSDPSVLWTNFYLMINMYLYVASIV